uniref:Uncharacterized protein n=1 Tax=Romanomermis culicivorax TaxID=13658 RepID=A0A915KKP7_ROMCU
MNTLLATLFVPTTSKFSSRIVLYSGATLCKIQTSPSSDEAEQGFSLRNPHFGTCESHNIS